MAPVVKAEELARWTLELCAIPSVTGDEAAAADAVAAWAAAMGPDVVVRRLGNALVCHGALVAGRPTVGLFGHLDTVKPAADQPLALTDGRVFGCGASDMKAGLAVMLGLLATRGSHGRADVVAVFYDKEEGPADENGLGPLLASGLVPPLDFGFCLEPTDNRLQAGCVGGLHAEVRFGGRRAHSARPWQGENALHKAGPFLTRLAERQRRPVGVGGLTFYEVMTATTARTENSRNVVPDRFVVNVNYRYAPGKSLEAAQAELLALVGGEAEVEFVDAAPAGDVCADHPLVSGWRETLGLALEPKQAWTDVARLTRMGIPALNFGPGETAQAHQARESVAVAEIVSHFEAFQAFFA